jgi:thymidylate synthase
VVRVGGLPIDADAAIHHTLSDIMRDGLVTDTTDDGQRELIGYQTGLARPLARITVHSCRPLNITSAIARFAWMVGGNDRLADIAFYEPKVRNYSDDQLTVPGSDYGRRIMQPRPGLNQLTGVVARLREDPNSRRAATVIWNPEDAVRQSNDIPCAFGTFYHIRQESLVATTIMRSNNAFLLLAYNIFEFSLLAELIASELELPFRTYIHWSASMHVLNRESDRARALVQAGPSVSREMPTMPSEVSPIAQARLLAVHEAQLRQSSGRDEALRVRDAAAADLHPYWLAFFDVLAVHRLKSCGADADVIDLCCALPDYFSTPLRQTLKSRPGPSS